MLLVAAAIALSAFDHSHALWTEVVEAHACADGVDYKKLKDDRAKLDAYLASLETVMPEEFAAWKREQQCAFWIDAYNAYALRRVVDAYPLASVHDIGDGTKDVFDEEFIPLGGLFPEAADRKLSLNDVANKILRPKFKDARVLAALHAPARGAPRLARRAFVAEHLDDQLDAQVADWLADPERNRFDEKTGTIRVSKIFDWNKGDFVRDAGSVQAWITARAPASERKWLASAKELKVEFIDYSWKLDEAR
jgi:hypothetical protein